METRVTTKIASCYTCHGKVSARRYANGGLPPRAGARLGVLLSCTNRADLYNK
jgi:hypothetical protein